MASSKPVPSYVLDWTAFPPEAGPAGCSTQRFALGNVVQQKLRDLSLSAVLASNDRLNGRAATPCVLALAGCIRGFADLLADCAVDPKTSSWASRERKEELARWIALRIWRKVDPRKRMGFDPESLVLVGITDEKGKVMDTAQKVKVVSEKFQKFDGPPFDYKAIVVKDGKLYRLHLCLDSGDNADLADARRVEGGKTLTGSVAMDVSSKTGKCIVLVIDDEGDREYDDVEEFLSEWVLNGHPQRPGVVEEVGAVPPLDGSREFEYEKEGDGDLARSVWIRPAPAALFGPGAEDKIECGDAFINEEGVWFSMVAIHETDDGPRFDLFSMSPPAENLYSTEFYPFENEDREDLLVDLDDLLNNYVIVSKMDERSVPFQTEAEVTTFKGEARCVVLRKGYKAMRFRIGDKVPGAGKLAAIMDADPGEDSMFAYILDGDIKLPAFERFDEVMSRASYWEDWAPYRTPNERDPKLAQALAKAHFGEDEDEDE